MKHAITLAACLILTACGGGGGADPAAPVPTPAAPIASCAPVVVALFGDSTLAGADGAIAGQALVADRPAEILQRQLDARLGAGMAKVVDRAVSGTDSGQLLAGTDGRNQAWPQPLVETAARVAVLNHGINDMGHGADLATYRQRLQTLIGGAQAAGVRLVMQTQVPQLATGVYGAAWRVEGIKGYAATMRDVATAGGLRLAEVSGFVEGLPGFEAEIPDGVHPTQALYSRIYAAPVADVVAAEVKALPCKVQ